MSQSNDTTGPPRLLRDENKQIIVSSLADLIQWFMTYDQRTTIIRHPKVEELFHWKQEQSRNAGEEVYDFEHAEDRLAIGIMQALAEHPDESKLHDWIGQLLNALDDAVKTNEAITAAYKLGTDDVESTVKEAEKIPAANERKVYLTCCWLEALCTAELRITGWIYQELYGRPFTP
ncbi:MAG: hypothetical protein QOJ64_435 [Acidobacteriota bacterium]|jgi:hypothetical protein|nr:hypothetical protein [Acidobacteriota bacterium]